jgi:GDP-L-fucose synthase
MRVLLTGGAGMVGRNVAEAAASARHELVAPTRAELNLFDAEGTRRYIERVRPDIVIHAAGRVGGIQANIAAPVAFLVENIDMGRNIVVAAMQAGVRRLINLGSSCIYPRAAENPLREFQILTGELEPTNEGYAIAKIATMRLCAYVNRERADLSYKTLIPCNLFGRFDKFDLQAGHMVPAVIAKLDQAAKRGDDIAEIWGDGTARREFMYAGDLADAVWRAVDDFDSLPETLNVGVGYDYAINEYYQTIAEVVGFRGRFVHDLSKPAGMKQKLMDVSRMRAWGFEAAHTLRQGIERAYQYYLEAAPAARA